MNEPIATEKELARQVHETNMKGIKGEIQGGRPGRRRGGSVVHEATSTPKDEGAPNALWTVKPKQREWDVSPTKPTFQKRQHQQQAAVREAQAAEAKRIASSQAQMRVNRYRHQLEALSPQKLREKLTSSYAKMMFSWPPSQEVRSEFLLASAEWAAREVLVEAMSDSIAKETAELEHLDS